jgi:hypothetical protein
VPKTPKNETATIEIEIESPEPTSNKPELMDDMNA